MAHLHEGREAEELNLPGHKFSTVSTEMEGILTPKRCIDSSFFQEGQGEEMQPIFCPRDLQRSQTSAQLEAL